MKHKQLHTLFAWLSAALMLASACVETGLEGPRPEQQEAGIVSVRLQIQNQGILTKADGAASEKALPHISDGTKVDQLILAVYSSTSEDGPYTISNHDGKVTVQNVANDAYTSAWKGNQMTLTFNNPGAFAGEENGLTLKIRVEEGMRYKLVCWAQNSECKAFDTDDLTQVHVKYENAKNNDELRDAFCKASDPFTSEAKGLTVVLRRPFAQINVGTAGWDYEGAARLKPGPVTYTESTITLSGVAQCYDVLKGEAVVDNVSNKLMDVTFDYATIPAFYNVKLEDGETYKYTPYIEEDNKVIEEFLKIRESNPYVGWDDYKSWSIKEQNGTLEGSDTDPFTTETFKYLSMCYVLVPETSSGFPEYLENKGATLASVSFMIRGINNDNSDNTTDDDGDGDGYTYFMGKTGEVFTLKNVPVQKNWRTNIVGYDFFTTRSEFKLWVVPDYCGDFNDIHSPNQDSWHNVDFDENGNLMNPESSGDKNSGFRDPGKDYSSKTNQSEDPEDQQ